MVSFVIPHPVLPCPALLHHLNTQMELLRSHWMRYLMWLLTPRSVGV